jgi:hypothetical protein
VAQHPLVLEQRALALGKVGDPTGAVGQLEELIASQGGTPERYGLLGGRYKELYRRATAESDRGRYLELAIDAYEHGMLLDLNSYYNASNLAASTAIARSPATTSAQAETQLVTMRACNRVIELGIADEWARPTLLGCAFDRRDVEGARSLLKDVQREGAGSWKLQTTLADLEDDLADQPTTTSAGSWTRSSTVSGRSSRAWRRQDDRTRRRRERAHGRHAGPRQAPVPSRPGSARHPRRSRGARRPGASVRRRPS